MGKNIVYLILNIHHEERTKFEYLTITTITFLENSDSLSYLFSKNKQITDLTFKKIRFFRNFR